MVICPEHFQELVIFSTESACADCPRGFEMNAETCYYFSHGEETWIGAYVRYQLTL
jgi:hypothetical protein